MINRYLPTALRRTLEKTVKDARVVAEEGAQDAIRRLGVAEGKAPLYLTDDEKLLRRSLRAHARALGDEFDRSDEGQATKRLIEAAAYAHWHRMLFARFLAERGLLRNPEYDVPVSLEDCRELAEAEGLSDAWAIAERYSAEMLPAVFHVNDPVLALELDPVHTQKLNRLVSGLNEDVFQAEDSLGWTYQFWRAAEKDAVNKSGVKIGAEELPAVTQLFTEPYMVRFLLHNTLGAWWAGKVLAADPTLAQTAANEADVRAACSLPDYTFDMLRFVRESGSWRPASGAFPGWPKEAKAITMLDPCCGSGHFLTEALAILSALRQTEEGLSSASAVAAVLRDNLHGLEIDGRCVQIAAFAVALTAWRIGGWQNLPLPHIAWVGAPPPLPKGEFIALADGNAELEYALEALFDLFKQAPLLGTLLEPSGGDLFESEKLKHIERLLEPLIESSKRAEPETAEGALAARGMADAAWMLHQSYVLQATNVPFLGRNNQNPSLVDFISRRYVSAKADLATVMMLRILKMANTSGSICLVTPQNWLYLKRFESLRRDIISNNTINIIGALGPRAFETISGEVVNTLLTVITSGKTCDRNLFAGIDANNAANPNGKIAVLNDGHINIFNDIDQLENPDAIISASCQNKGSLLNEFCDCYQGASTLDIERFRAFFWEVRDFSYWNYHQSTPCFGKLYSGLEFVSASREEETPFTKEAKALKEEARLGGAYSGRHAWGKMGVVCSWMGDLPASLYCGPIYDNMAAVFIPESKDLLLPIYCYVSSPEYKDDVRRINQKLQVANSTLAKVVFDLERWKRVAKENFPDGIPGPYSNEPTQWIFHGHPSVASPGTALHVALARVCGYRWPGEIDPHMHLSAEARAWIAKVARLPAGDNDGLLGVPAVAGEKSLVDRLRVYLAAAFDSDWSDDLERQMVAEADEALDKKTARDCSLEAWVRDRAFRQHCALFGQRPFLWHISDGLKDGFSVFVHYQRFDQANLRKLTYTLLGDWLARAKAENNGLRYEKGRELQQMLEKVLEGEKPYDIFVRWKSLAKQPLGWAPDLDDGVRQDIRPFIMAGVLTHDLTKILKDKDRGTDVISAPWYPVFKGERRINHHTTLAEKRAARDEATKRLESVK